MTHRLTGTDRTTQSRPADRNWRLPARSGRLAEVGRGRGKHHGNWTVRHGNREDSSPEPIRARDTICWEGMGKIGDRINVFPGVSPISISAVAGTERVSSVGHLNLVCRRFSPLITCRWHAVCRNDVPRPGSCRPVSSSVGLITQSTTAPCQ